MSRGIAALRTRMPAITMRSRLIVNLARHMPTVQFVDFSRFLKRWRRRPRS
jgi:hypothetical protein